MNGPFSFLQSALEKSLHRRNDLITIRNISTSVQQKPCYNLRMAYQLKTVYGITVKVLLHYVLNVLMFV